jgi:hypothetical protein
MNHIDREANKDNEQEEDRIQFLDFTLDRKLGPLGSANFNQP